MYGRRVDVRNSQNPRRVIEGSVAVEMQQEKLLCIHSQMCKQTSEPKHTAVELVVLCSTETTSCKSKKVSC